MVVCCSGDLFVVCCSSDFDLLFVCLFGCMLLVSFSFILHVQVTHHFRKADGHFVAVPKSQEHDRHINCE